jgi:quercetin dioxygenase-like cupin family protein
MRIVTFDNARTMEFPANRTTRVMLGPGTVEAENFVVGYVQIQPGGEVPLHSHENEEAYTILQGGGLMTVGDETCEMRAVSTVHIPPDKPHSLKNPGDELLVMMFVYSPSGLVGHWAEELAEPED